VASVEPSREGASDLNPVGSLRHGRSSASVQSLLRALDLMEALGRLGDSRLGELASEVGLHPSTVHRLLSTLSERGFVTQDGPSGRYRLGYAVLALAQDAGKQTGELRAVARPHLNAIRDASGETVNLVVMERGRAVCIEQAEGTRRVRMNMELGRGFSMHSVASGKLFLAHTKDWRAALDHDEPYDRLTAQTKVTAQELELEFAAIRDAGVSIEREENEIGVTCVAAPVFSGSVRPTAAISVCAPTTRLLEMQTGLTRLLRRHAAELSRQLGHYVLSPREEDGARTLKGDLDRLDEARVSEP
jgi:IclR family KDG regulon transcriptional repressor